MINRGKEEEVETACQDNDVDFYSEVQPQSKGHLTVKKRNSSAYTQSL